MKHLWNIFGFSSLGLGLVGIAVPGMPTTVFFIIALGCFTKSENSRIRHWLLNHKTFGQILQDWEEERSIPLKIKWISCTCIVLFTTLSMFVIPLAWVKGFVIAIAISGIGYIISKKTKQMNPELSTPQPLDLAS